MVLPNALLGSAASEAGPPVAWPTVQMHDRDDVDAFRLDAGAVVRELMQGEPPIAISRRGERLLHVSVWMMRPGEHKIVTGRLRDIFTVA